MIISPSTSNWNRVSVDCQLAPEHPFPAPIEDCYAGSKWLFRDADEFGVDPSRIAIGGASGGQPARLALLSCDPEKCRSLSNFSSTDDR
jgi:acetyl esterase/lipase